MSDVALQTIKAVLSSAPFFEEKDEMTCAAMLAEVKPHWWQPVWLGNVVSRVQEHLMAGRRFGLVALKADVQGEWLKLEKAAEIESIRVGIEAVKLEGKKQDFLKTLEDSKAILEGESPEAAASFVTTQLAAQMAGSTGLVASKDMQSPVALRKAVLDKPGFIVSLHPSVNQFLRWGGLPALDKNIQKEGSLDLGGETIIACARSGGAKTAFAISCALSIAVRGHKVNYNVLSDASAEEIFERMTYAIAGISISDKRPLQTMLQATTKRPKETLETRLLWAEGILRGLPISVNDETNVNQHMLRVRLHDTKMKGVFLSVWDNLDHFRWDAKEERIDRREQLGRLANIIREFDKSTGHHSLVLAQANRDSLNNPDSIPLQHNTQDSDLPKNECTLFLGFFNPNVAGGRFGSNADILGEASKSRNTATGRFTLPISIVNPNPGEVLA